MDSLLARILMRLAFLPLVVWLFILLPAGTNDFWQVYAYFGFILLPMFFGLVYFLKHDPELLERRLKAREEEQTQKWVVAIMGLSVVAIYVIPGLDKRFGWSDIPVWLVLIGDALAVGAYVFMMYVFKVNSFAARTIEVEKNQTVIDTGPYALVRHPMYLGALIMYLGTPVALGSWWAFLPVVVIPFCLLVRIHNEEEVLCRELDGYEDYCTRRRWRLMPGVW